MSELRFFSDFGCSVPLATNASIDTASTDLSAGLESGVLASRSTAPLSASSYSRAYLYDGACDGSFWTSQGGRNVSGLAPREGYVGYVFASPATVRCVRLCQAAAAANRADAISLQVSRADARP